jgi:hypothetical protein
MSLLLLTALALTTLTLTCSTLLSACYTYIPAISVGNKVFCKKLKKYQKYLLFFMEKKRGSHEPPMGHKALRWGKEPVDSDYEEDELTEFVEELDYNRKELKRTEKRLRKKLSKYLDHEKLGDKVVRRLEQLQSYHVDMLEEYHKLVLKLRKLSENK